MRGETQENLERLIDQGLIEEFLEGNGSAVSVLNFSRAETMCLASLLPTHCPQAAWGS